MEKPNRLVFGLAVTAVVWCVAAAVWMTTMPIMNGGRRPTAGEAVLMVSIPACFALVASWAAWQRRRAVLVTMTVLAGLFSLVTGFSIGNAFVPTFGLLAWASIASIDDGPRSSSDDAAR